jgi:DNA mismatch repair protein MutS2
LKEAAAAATLKARARSELREAERQHREVWEQATAAAEEELAELRREAHRVRLQLASARERGIGLEPARAAIDEALALPNLKAPPAPVRAPVEPVPAEPATVALGAEVVVPRLGLPGRVLAIRDDTVEVEVLGRRVHMALRELEGATRATRRDQPPVERAPTISLASDRGDVPLQLDLRGLRRDEALEQLETYLEDAALAGLPSARIVHGKGTGAIRQAVRELLRSSPHVSRFASEPDATGGDGATQVFLK